jgi:hypothetical protein
MTSEDLWCQFAGLDIVVVVVVAGRRPGHHPVGAGVRVS